MSLDTLGTEWKIDEVISSLDKLGELDERLRRIEFYLHSIEGMIQDFYVKEKKNEKE